LGKTAKTLGGNDICNELYHILLFRAITAVDVIYNLCKSITADIVEVYNSNNNIKYVIFGENYDEPEYVKSTITNRPYPHVIKRSLSAFNAFFSAENQKLERERERKKRKSENRKRLVHTHNNIIIIIVYIVL